MEKTGIDKLLSFIAEGLILFDKTGSVVLVNPHASLLLDVTAEDSAGKKLGDIIDLHVEKRSVDEEKDIVQFVFSQEKSFRIHQGENAYIVSMGRRKFPVFIAARRMRINGEELGALIFRDITTQKELETYRENAASKIAQLTPLLQKTATGDFSDEIVIPQEEDEFTELLVGLKLMFDDLRELDQEKAQYSTKLEESVKEKTKELSVAKNHIEAVVENLPNGIIEYSDKMIIKSMNRMAEKILNVKRKDVVGYHIKEADIQDKKLGSVARVFFPKIGEEETRISRREGNIIIDDVIIHHPEERDLQISTVSLSVEEESEKGFIKIVRDATREKLISRTKSEFISIAAHQLRTPLSGLKWSMRLVLDEDLGPVNKEQKEMLERGYGIAEKMVILVNDMLNVARIEDGRFGYVFKKADIVGVVAALVAASDLLAKERNVALTFDHPNTPIEFTFDPEKVSLAVQNLVSNAIKYTPENGKVNVSVYEEDGFARVKVVDTGVGIPEKQIPRLFTKFFRASNVMQMQTEGSGLGLFIVQNIATRHGGKTTVESKENKGSTFTFMLPLEEGSIPEEEVLT